MGATSESSGIAGTTSLTAFWRGGSRSCSDSSERRSTVRRRARYRVISVCSGDGRDLLGVLPSHRRGREVRARLVEQDETLAARGRSWAQREGLDGVEVVHGDASITDAYRDAVPADLVLVCGVFGNVSDSDVHNTVIHLAEMCAAGATVIWTRGRFEHDLTPAIRAWFSDAGFEEIEFVAVPGTSAAVAAHRFVGEPRPAPAGVRLFTFLEEGKRPSRRGARSSR